MPPTCCLPACLQGPSYSEPCAAPWMSEGRQPDVVWSACRHPPAQAARHTLRARRPTPDLHTHLVGAGLREHCVWRDSPLIHAICQGVGMADADAHAAAHACTCALRSSSSRPPACPPSAGSADAFLAACDATGTSLCGRWPVAAFMRVAEVRLHATGGCTAWHACGGAMSRACWAERIGSTTRRRHLDGPSSSCPTRPAICTWSRRTSTALQRSRHGRARAHDRGCLAACALCRPPPPAHAHTPPCPSAGCPVAHCALRLQQRRTGCPSRPSAVRGTGVAPKKRSLSCKRFQ